ncbi:MAG: hypothetical protein ACAI44_40620 [Candidatus Sericytochromatia bacterium]
MKRFVLLSLLSLAVSLPAQAFPGKKDLLPELSSDQITETSVPIRVRRPLLVDFGGTFPKLPGIGVSYNLTENFAIGVHGSYLHVLNSVGALGRYYFFPDNSSLYAELGGHWLNSTLMSSANFYGATLMLGYEIRNENGFTLGGGAGLSLSATPLGIPPLLPAFSFSIGHAF